MSIALSTTIRPSRLWLWLQLAMASVLLMVCMWLLNAAANVPVASSLSTVLAVICAIASCALVAIAFRPRTALRIDVTGLGQIRLVETNPDAEAGLHRRSNAEGEVVQLCQGSTLWSSLMVLRLQSVSGRMTTLILLPDSLSGDAFRALSVACRWIVARHIHQDALRSDSAPWVG